MLLVWSTFPSLILLLVGCSLGLVLQSAALKCLCQYDTSRLLLSRFTEAIDSINKQLEQHAEAKQDVHFTDCGHHFVSDGASGQIRSSLMPDGLNLSQAGMEELASCLDPTIQVTRDHYTPSLGWHVFLFIIISNSIAQYMQHLIGVQDVSLCPVSCALVLTDLAAMMPQADLVALCSLPQQA